MKTNPVPSAKARPPYLQKSTRQESLLDEALAASFPASDPIATRITRLNKKTSTKKKKSLSA